jgi:hypothetical protein
MQYQIYTVGGPASSLGQYIGVDELECETDREAIFYAVDTMGYENLDIWNRGRFVMGLVALQPPGSSDPQAD